MGTDPRADDQRLTRRWQSRHAGYEVAGVLRVWLRVCWWLARPLAAARVPPDAVTMAGAGAAIAATRSRPGRASLWLLASGLADGLDGAVAVVRDTTTGHGRALDHAADRVGDTAAAIVLYRAGAPAWLLAPAVAGTFAVEWRRDRRAPRVTAAERPSRIISAVLGDVAVAVTRRQWPAVVAAIVWDVLTVVAIGQRYLAEPPG